MTRTTAVPTIPRPGWSATVTQQSWSAQGWGTDGAGVDRPSVARVNDYLLGGAYNVAADRKLAAQLVGAVPDARRMARESRAFLARAVRFCVEAGVRQFLDLGSGVAAAGTTHEVAHRAAGDARVLYVDLDPVAVALVKARTAGIARTGVIEADLRRPDDILDHRGRRALLDLDEPIAVLLVCVLDFVSDAEDPGAIVARIRDRIAPGSHLVISHYTVDGGRPDAMAAITDMGRQAGTPLTFRTAAEIEGLFTGFDLVDPGVVWVPWWRPESPEEAGDWAPRSSILAGVGRRPRIAATASTAAAGPPSRSADDIPPAQERGLPW